MPPAQIEISSDSFFYCLSPDSFLPARPFIKPLLHGQLPSEHHGFISSGVLLLLLSSAPESGKKHLPQVPVHIHHHSTFAQFCTVSSLLCNFVLIFHITLFLIKSAAFPASAPDTSSMNHAKWAFDQKLIIVDMTALRGQTETGCILGSFLLYFPPPLKIHL